MLRRRRATKVALHERALTAKCLERENSPRRIAVAVDDAREDEALSALRRCSPDTQRVWRQSLSDAESGIEQRADNRRRSSAITARGRDGRRVKQSNDRRRKCCGRRELR